MRRTCVAINHEKRAPVGNEGPSTFLLDTNIHLLRTEVSAPLLLLFYSAMTKCVCRWVIMVRPHACPPMSKSGAEEDDHAGKEAL